MKRSKNYLNNLVQMIKKYINQDQKREEHKQKKNKNSKEKQKRINKDL